MTSYVYIKSKHEQLWTVGFYDPSGKWEPESDHIDPNDAAARVAWLNGGGVGAELVGAELDRRAP